MLRTLARVIAFTPGLACRARSTVPVEIPSARAMSLIPTGCAGAVGFRASEDMRRSYYLFDHAPCIRRSARRHRRPGDGSTAAIRTTCDNSRRRLGAAEPDEAGLGVLR